MNNIKYYTPEMKGSGQYGICLKCKKPPVLDPEDGKEHEVYDGCMGKLPDPNIMNACCGHGNDKWAYVQFWAGERLGGEDACEYIKENKISRSA